MDGFWGHDSAKHISGQTWTCRERKEKANLRFNGFSINDLDVPQGGKNHSKGNCSMKQIKIFKRQEKKKHNPTDFLVYSYRSC